MANQKSGALKNIGVYCPNADSAQNGKTVCRRCGFAERFDRNTGIAKTPKMPLNPGKRYKRRGCQCPIRNTVANVRGKDNKRASCGTIGDSHLQIRKQIRATCLISEIPAMTDEGKTAMQPAAERPEPAENK